MTLLGTVHFIILLGTVHFIILLGTVHFIILLGDCAFQHFVGVMMGLAKQFSAFCLEHHLTLAYATPASLACSEMLYKPVLQPTCPACCNAKPCSCYRKSKHLAHFTGNADHAPKCSTVS